MKFSTLIIIACMSVTAESLGSLRLEDKLSKKSHPADLAQGYNSEIVDEAIVNANKQEEADWGLKGSVRGLVESDPGEEAPRHTIADDKGEHNGNGNGKDKDEMWGHSNYMSVEEKIGGRGGSPSIIAADDVEPNADNKRVTKLYSTSNRNNLTSLVETVKIDPHAEDELVTKIYYTSDKNDLTSLVTPNNVEPIVVGERVTKLYSTSDRKDLNSLVAANNGGPIAVNERVKKLFSTSVRNDLTEMASQPSVADSSLDVAGGRYLRREIVGGSSTAIESWRRKVNTKLPGHFWGSADSSAADVDLFAGQEPDSTFVLDAGSFNHDPDQGKERKLLASWCKRDTPVLWHPDYQQPWSTAGCVSKPDCDSPGYSTQLECCQTAYGGQVSGACIRQLLTSSTDMIEKWYADYGKTWSDAGCKSATPYPSYATTFFNSQLACCKGAFGGQTSGACLRGLPNTPTTAPITAGGLGGKWYADYGTVWSDAGCKMQTTAQLPIYVATLFDSQLECCKGAYMGQMSSACIKGLPKPPTTKPTASPTSNPSTARPSSIPTSTPTVTPTITVTITSTAGFPFNTAGRCQLQQVDISNAFKAVMKNTVNQLLIGKLFPGQTMVDVKITWGEVMNNILQVTFEIILEELCTINCANQAAETNLDNDVKDAMDEAFVSGVFVTTFKAKADTTIAEATSADPNYVADSLLVPVQQGLVLSLWL